MRHTVRGGRRTGAIAAALLGALLMATSVRADVVTEKSASILIFPKVIADSETDTVIQITNTSNSMVHARCFYVDARLQEFHHPIGLTSSRSAAFNVQFTGTRARPDYINLSPIECGPNPGQEPCP